ncbi:MAG: ATP-dependent DNA ligase [Vulcanimicrobiaceae bacterium]
MLPIALDFAPMEAQAVKSLPTEGPYQFEPKWDGFRALCFRDGDTVHIQSKSGQPLARYFPELVADLLAASVEHFVLDGELVVAVDGRFDFDQLLQRIHPAASRVKMLAAAFPATYIVFDLLVDETRAKTYMQPLTMRRPQLERFAGRYFTEMEQVQLSVATTDPEVAAEWYLRVGGAIDGIVAKRADIPYSSGDRHGMVKVKSMRTADCIVGGYRVSNDGTSIGSLLLGLYDADGHLDYVGFTSGFSATEKRSLLKELAAMKSQSAFTARSPGGPSRWSRGKESAWVPVAPTKVLEVEFDHVSGGRFRHGTKPLRFRPDKDPAQCTTDQLAAPAGSPLSISPGGW